MDACQEQLLAKKGLNLRTSPPVITPFAFKSYLTPYSGWLLLEPK
jgi:hypothetical protein